MARLAVAILQRASGASPPGVMRRITASLEALSAYGTLEGAPQRGPAGRGRCAAARVRCAGGAGPARRSTARPRRPVRREVHRVSERKPRLAARRQSKTLGRPRRREGTCGGTTRRSSSAAQGRCDSDAARIRWSRHARKAAAHAEADEDSKKAAARAKGSEDADRRPCRSSGCRTRGVAGSTRRVKNARGVAAGEAEGAARCRGGRGARAGQRRHARAREPRMKAFLIPIRSTTRSHR